MQVRFIFALHNHQPVGNFSHVFEQTYRESYLPFLDVFEQYPQVKVAFHLSGSLIEWLSENHSEYLDRLALLVERHRVEIIGGAFFEPILAMLPSRDRIGQIRLYTDWLERRLSAKIRGLWIPERVWEQSYVRDLVDAGINYTILDDCHFRSAGLTENELTRHYLTEDDGRTMSVFPGSERLRYLIPFGNVDETIRHLAEIGERANNAVVVHADDGEKFGTWPQTHSHVYHDKWLHHFFDALSENANWLITTTPSEAILDLEPLGKIYIPDGSYREMTEWVLRPDQQNELHNITNKIQNHSELYPAKKFLRGGFWRNFKLRYPESDEMYSRMMSVSMRLETLTAQGFEGYKIDTARELLYRGQCNCSYWHGAFGGIYLPHLRNAVYSELIKADNAIDDATEKESPWVETQTSDFNFDGRNEVRLSNEHVYALFAPHRGGMMYELDVKKITHNLLATLTRREEAYHDKVRAGQKDSDGNFGSIHDRVVFKQAGLENHLRYDHYPRKSLIDLFYDYDTNIGSIIDGSVTEHGDFVQGDYDAVIRKKDKRIQLLMTREGVAYGRTIKISKAISLSAESNTFDIAYRFENLPKGYRLHFATELNFAGMPGGADDRYFHVNGERYGDLSSTLDLYNTTELGLFDDWLGIDARLKTSHASNFYVFPIETVSQSEGGFELVHQSVAVQPHWYIEPDATGCWSIDFQLIMDTTVAERREQSTKEFLRDAARMLVSEEC